jgi:PLP dependent protein
MLSSAVSGVIIHDQSDRNSETHSLLDRVLPEAEIRARLSEVMRRIAAAADCAHRPRESVRLILAAKSQPAEAVRRAYHSGAREFGENYVQEAAAKRRALSDLAGIRWHLIGHLQTNKTKLAAEIFDTIQSLDSLRLATAISRFRPAPPMPCLIEVNLGGELSKSGVGPDGVEKLVNEVRNKVQVMGLMAVPPPGKDAEASRPYFVALRTLRDRLALQTGLALAELSMGMSDDFEVAIEEGATIVRVGRAVFGERPS